MRFGSSRSQPTIQAMALFLPWMMGRAKQNRIVLLLLPAVLLRRLLPGIGITNWGARRLMQEKYQRREPGRGLQVPARVSIPWLPANREDFPRGVPRLLRVLTPSLKASRGFQTLQVFCHVPPQSVLVR